MAATGQQTRIRVSVEDLARAGEVGARLTRAEGRAVAAPEALSLAISAGLLVMEKCFACRESLPCSVHGPAPVVKGKGKAPVEKPAHVRYAEAYAEGQIEASGADFAVPGYADKMALIQMSIAHAKREDAAGRFILPIVGDELIEWFKATSAEFRRAMASEALYTFTPRRCLTWLDAGRPAPKAAQPKRLSTRQAAPSLEGRVSE